MIKLEGITKSFGTLQVLKGIDLEINKGEIVSIVGPSGAGKTTLLQIMGTLDKPDTGSVQIDGTLVSRMKEKELSAFRNKNIGFVFQFHQLLPEFTALENVMIPAFIAGISSKEANGRAVKILDFMGLANRASHKPNELSGGEKQRWRWHAPSSMSRLLFWRTNLPAAWIRIIKKIYINCFLTCVTGWGRLS